MRNQIEKVTSNAGRSDSGKPDSLSQNIDVQTQFYGQDGDMAHGNDDYYDYDDNYNYSDTEEDETTPSDAFYSQPAPYNPYRPRGSRRGGGWFPRNNLTPPSGPRLNTPDEYGNPTRCSFCKSTYHYVSQCPDAAKQAAVKGRGGASTRRGNGCGGRGMHGGRGGGSKYI